MAYSNGTITAPVSVADVQKAVPVILTTTLNGVTYRRLSGDVGLLCSAQDGDTISGKLTIGSTTYNVTWTVRRSADINKWAKFKPVKVAKIGRLTYSEIADAKFGLVPALNTILKTFGDGSGGANVTDSTVLENILNANLDWTYNRPTGGTNSPYRLTDFYAPADNDGGYGYYHDTPQPMSGVSDWGLNLKDIETCLGSIPYTAGSPISAWKVGVNTGIAAPVYSRLSFRFGSSSYDNVGGMDVKAIPLNDLLGIMNTAEYWRLAIAVQVPSSEGNLQTMRFFSSRWSFLDAHEQSNSPSLVLPCLSTNQTLCNYIVEYADYLKTVSGTDVIGNTRTSEASPTFRLPACLCLVKSMFLDRDSINGNTYNHCKIGGESLIYSTPSAMSRFEIIVTDNKNYSNTDAYQLAVISNVSTGTYAQMGEESWKRHEIRAAVLQQKEYAMPNTTIYYRVTYSYVAGYSGNTPLIITNTAEGEVTLATSGNTLVSLTLAGGPSLTISERTLSTSPLNG
ncbi:MAG: hypothetical protein II886_13185 [Prevotella sp.]|nr:hypothetical protein [Prevotella sp.]